MSTDTTNWDQAEDVEVPQGAYIGWGKPGQVIAGKVVSYSDTAGKDFNEQPCPLLSLELLDAGDSYREKGTKREELAAGERVVINAGQYNLKKALEEAQPRQTDKIRIEFTEEVRLTGGNTVKKFAIKLIRGTGNPWD